MEYCTHAGTMGVEDCVHCNQPKEQILKLTIHDLDWAEREIPRLRTQAREARKQAFEDAVKIVEGIENRYAKNPFPCHPADAVKCVVEALRRGTEKDV